MKTTRPDLYELGAVPVNTDAGKELRQPEVPYKAAVLWGDHSVFETQPPFGEWPPKTDHLPKEYARVNYVGHKKGWLTVVGFGHKIPTQKGPKSYKWICRCVCGKFVVRSTQSLREGKEVPEYPDACPECRHLNYMRAKDKAKQVGHYQDGKPYTE